MSQKKNKDRKKNVSEYKKKAAEINKIRETAPKTHLVPRTEWQSTEILLIRGDMLERLEGSLATAYQHMHGFTAAMQKAAGVYQEILGLNIKEKKIKLGYTWNNGQEATPQEIASFEQQMQQLNEEKIRTEKRKQEQEEYEEKGSNLVTPSGAPLTEGNLEIERQQRDGGGLIIPPHE